MLTPYELRRYKNDLRALFAYYSSVHPRRLLRGEGGMASTTLLTMTEDQWIAFCKASGIVNEAHRGYSLAELQVWRNTEALVLGTH